MRIWFDSGGMWYDDISGAGVHIRELVGWLSKMGHDVVAFVGIRDKTQSTDNQNTVRIRSPLRDFPTALENEAFLILHMLWRLFGKKELPDLIYRRHSYLGVGLLVGKILGIPVITEVNGLKRDYFELNFKRLRFLGRIVGFQTKLEYRNSNRIVAVTDRIKEVISKRYGIPPEKITVIPNGANTELFAPINRMKSRSVLSIEPEKKVIFFVGYLTPIRGVEYLVASAPVVLEQLSDVVFLIGGDGPEFKNLVSLARRLGLEDNVRFIGRIPYESVPMYMSASDVCVAPFAKTRAETMGLSPLKVYEYLACGRAVVASNIPGLEEIVKRSGGGILVPPESPKELARALIGLLADNGSREKMEKRGRSFALQECSWESVARRVSAICVQTVDETKRP